MFTNPGFYFAWVVIAIFPLVIAIFAPDTGRNRIIAILLTLVITFGFAILLYQQSEGDHDRWNNGIHVDCGGEYQFSSATNWHGSKDYYYTCDKCGHTEEFSSIMK